MACCGNTYRRIYRCIATSRAAAIWALGLIHAEHPDEKLADQFLERLLDYAIRSCRKNRKWLHVGRQPRTHESRPHARWTADSAGDSSGLQTSIGHASAWAMQQITGEAIGEIEPFVEMQVGWF